MTNKIMKKKKTKTWRVMLLLIVLCITAYSVFCEKSEYPIGRDTYTYFGNGKYDIMRNDYGLGLFTNDYSSALIAKVKKYVEIGDLILVEGYYTSSYVDESHTGLVFYNNIETNEYEHFPSIEETPRYTVLNFRTDQIALYRDLSEAPADIQYIFKREPSFLCRVTRSCYKE